MAYANGSYHPGYSYPLPNSPQLLPVDNPVWVNGVWTGSYVCVIPFRFMPMDVLTSYTLGGHTFDRTRELSDTAWSWYTNISNHP